MKSARMSHASIGGRHPIIMLKDMNIAENPLKYYWRLGERSVMVSERRQTSLGVPDPQGKNPVRYTWNSPISRAKESVEKSAIDTETDIGACSGSSSCKPTKP